MGQKTAIFKVVDAIPSKVGAAFGTLFAGGAALYPDTLRKWTDWLMSPEQIRHFGAIGLGLFIVYWAIWLWLRSSLKDEHAPGLTQTVFGANGPVVGSIQTAYFNPSDTANPIQIAAASEVVQILKEIEQKYCRTAYNGVLQLLEIDQTLRHNIVLAVGSKLGGACIEKEKFDESELFFEGGGSVLTTNIANFSGGPVRNLVMPKNEIIHVNFTKKAGEVKAELANLVLSPFMPREVGECVTALAAAVSDLYSQMIIVLNECFQNQRVRLIMAANDPLITAGLCNEYLERAVGIEKQITDLRHAIRKELEP
ncbi:MAG: hypothetical protein U0975_15670 [Erythrobacter sp.]|nr:hypothetical protein [Erythrobacter sp.]MDZ4274097.1 hypothetical protein [Erythrobacter sp.]